jgi:septal ring factor EnvC (AmiA/AmiB activator)
MRRTGTDLHYALGGGIVAPADAVVRYVGEQDGYGIIMILEHGANYATVLGPFEPESVSREIGDVVLAGDRLGRTGAPVEGNQAYLHVELRRNNQAVDPARLIR